MDDFNVIRSEGFQTIFMNWTPRNPGFVPGTFDIVSRALKAADNDPAIACTVFFGVPRCFCLGTDVAAFADIEDLNELSATVQRFFQSLINTKKPMIAAVDGTAIGLGMTMLGHFDAIFATPESLFKAPFVDWGLSPEAASSVLLPEAIGYRKTFELFCLGGELTASDAERRGLITSVIPKPQLNDHVIAAALRLAQLPERSLRTTRELLRHQRVKLIRRSRTETAIFQELLREATTQRRLKTMARASKMRLTRQLSEHTSTL
jgi:enoyl-CoA hydratase/carnithine racemase